MKGRRRPYEQNCDDLMESKTTTNINEISAFVTWC